MTLYASILLLQRQDIQALRMTDPYSVHRVVYSLFENVRGTSVENQQTTSGILYVDQGGTSLERRVMILSDRAPAEQATASDGRRAGVVRSKIISDDFFEHDSYQFKVIVNPTRRDSQSKKLIPIRGYDDIQTWFAKRAESDWGFKVEHSVVEKVDVLRFPNKNKQMMTLSHASIQGGLHVTDKVKFQASFAAGLGRNSAFGCGLLQIVPTRFNLF